MPSIAAERSPSTAGELMGIFMDRREMECGLMSHNNFYTIRLPWDTPVLYNGQDRVNWKLATSEPIRARLPSVAGNKPVGT